MKLTAEILEQAATWHVDLQQAAPGDPLHARHQQWLQQSPLHRQAWQRMEKLQHSFNRLPDNLTSVSLQNARYSRRHMIQALAVLLAVGVTGYSQRQPIANRFADQRTATGQRRSLTLDDGSQVEINTATALNIEYNSQQRILHLREGEVLVTTAADQRPFSVHTRHGIVRALGTRFQVYSTAHNSLVQVHQHSVEIRPTRADASPVILHSGQQSRFTPQQVGPIQPLAAHADSWTQDMLIVSNWSLGEFLDQLNRYHSGQISYTPAAAALRVSGAFHLDNTRAILDSLSATLPIQTRQLAGYWTRIDHA
ncbi:FecR domain-containing protein [Thiopseudomonas denitrificans]|uniref:FecR family protein n=1 Tax=Thiopseudomonas denitrificans TaxID=1501432 RepID=A0A4R6TT31_9GAMM|nr:FecR domain-containing protein [Thiopseudomonas denitrificans]TDQ36491.1 FecR family protein [Thiopseudomonas denitrificans]